MNLVTFNDSFKSGILANEDNKMWDKMRTSPIFVYDSPNIDRMNHNKDCAHKDRANAPFPVFRLAMLHSSNGKRATDNYVIDRGNFYHNYNREPFLIYIQPAPGNNNFYHDDTQISWGAPYHVFTNNMWREIPRDGDGEHQQHRVFVAINIYLSFLGDCAIPTNHIVSICPAQKDRSVEWVRARTHYTLITHGHPANKKAVSEGDRVQDDRQGEIARMAHARRAHYRTYRDSRYTYARGDTRLVRATWIGPKEWQDEGGKQIYKILEPVDHPVYLP